jgi:hypothetical protein
MSCLFALMSLKIVMQKVRKPYELEQRRQDRKKEKERKNAHIELAAGTQRPTTGARLPDETVPNHY